MKRLIKSAIQYNNLNTLFKRGSINYYNQLAFCSKNQKNEENDKKSFEFAEEENQREKEETKKNQIKKQEFLQRERRKTKRLKILNKTIHQNI